MLSVVDSKLDSRGSLFASGGVRTDVQKLSVLQDIVPLVRSDRPWSEWDLGGQIGATENQSLSPLGQSGVLGVRGGPFGVVMESEARG